jgi:hypothetical protein
VIDRIGGVRLAAVASLLFTFACGYRPQHRSDAPARYVAVLLQDGQFYLGRQQASGSDLIVLRDVYYLRTETDPRTGTPSTRLVPRESDWHEPDRLLLRAEHVASIEPVADGSDMAKAIRRLKNE